MINDLITFCEDIDELLAELVSKGYVNEAGEAVFPICDRTPTQKKDGKARSSLIRCVCDDNMALLESFGSLEILGTKAEVDADPVKTEKYLRTYSRDPVTYTDPETGEPLTYTPPKWHGAFA